MQRTFTPILWTYQNFRRINKRSSDLMDINRFLDPCPWFTRLLEKFQKQIPDIQDKTLQRILERV